MSNNSQFMLKAIELSIKSAKAKGGPFGCVIVKDNQIIAEGHNQVTSNNDPTADYPAACLGLGATIKTNKREIGADDFFISLFETALEEDEIVVSISFPIISDSFYMKFPNPASRYAMAGVFMSKNTSEVRVAVTGASENGVFRWAEMESSLLNDWSKSSVEKVKLSPEGIMSDIHGNSEYRANLANIMAIRAFEGINE